MRTAQWAILWLLAAYALSGCSWQGQRHTAQAADGSRTVSEWWSMRCLWVSSGVEAHVKSPYYEAGAQIEQSKTDAKALEALADGIACSVVRQLKEGGW